jgi:hypothetical protein
MGRQIDVAPKHSAKKKWKLGASKSFRQLVLLLGCSLETGVARWCVFKTKIQILVNFLGLWNEKMVNSKIIRNTLRPFGIFYDRLVIYIHSANLVYFPQFWYI